MIAKGSAPAKAILDPRSSAGDLDHLFEVGCHRGATAANLGGMNDPESDLGVRLAISRPAHLGARIGLEPVRIMRNGRDIEVPSVPLVSKILGSLRKSTESVILTWL